MFGTVRVPRRSVDRLRSHSGDQAVDLLHTLARPLRGARVLNLSVSPFGSGVADLLHSTVPLIRDLGLEAEWQVVTSDAEFGRVSRLMYAGLSGRAVAWNQDTEESWHRYGEFNARLFEGSYDVVLVHDPQPAGMLAALGERSVGGGRGKWIWHCHLDLRGAQPEVWESFSPVLALYDRWVLQDRLFAPPDPSVGLPVVIPPAIDPTGPRNLELPRQSVRQFCYRYRLDPRRPLAVQVSPFDASFDPIGAVEVYRRAKRERPDLQLLLVHSAGDATIDAWSRFEQIARHVGPDRDAQVLAGQGGGGEVLVNCAQRSANVMIQRSVPAGFSLPVWEGFWKGLPLVAGQVGGLPLQVRHGVDGYLAPDEDGLVAGLVALIGDPASARRFGEAGRRAVQEHHLITRYLADELRLLRGLLSHAGTEPNEEVPFDARSDSLASVESGYGA